MEACFRQRKLQKPRVCGTLKKMRHSSLCLQVEFEERSDEREGWRAGLHHSWTQMLSLKKLGYSLLCEQGNPLKGVKAWKALQFRKTTGLLVENAQGGREWIVENRWSSPQQ